jgi:hypothetical protein
VHEQGSYEPGTRPHHPTHGSSVGIRWEGSLKVPRQGTILCMDDLLPKTQRLTADAGKRSFTSELDRVPYSL